MATADLYQTTATLTLPTLVLAGGEDRKVPPDMQRETADLIAGAEFRLLPGAPHLAMLTDPARFGEALQRIPDPDRPWLTLGRIIAFHAQTPSVSDKGSSD